MGRTYYWSFSNDARDSTGIAPVRAARCKRFSPLRLSIHRALLSTRVRDEADTHGLSLFTVQHEVSGYSDIDDRIWTWGRPRPYSGLFRF